MTGEGRRRVGAYVRGGLVVVLLLLSLAILWMFSTAGYPTHADVFWAGVEFGVLLMGFLGCIVLVGYVGYRYVRNRVGEAAT